MYKEMNNLGYPINPTYLTMQWFPFVPAELTGMDYRWIVIIIFFIGIGFYIKMVADQSLEKYPCSLPKALLPFIAFILIFYKDSWSFACTVELMDLGYYLILFYGLYTNSTKTIVAGLVLCLLSRYSLILWVPFYILAVFFYHNKKKAIIMSAATLFFLTIFYFYPYLRVDPHSFFKGQDYYFKGALGEWSGQYWQLPGERPFQLYQKLGFASYFYEYVHGSISERLSFLKNFHLYISAFSLLLIFGFYHFKHKVLNLPLFSLISLKFYLTFFYSFIIVPYYYLFILPVFLSLFILGSIIWSQTKLKSAGSI
jgi:hypothetical protein